MESKEIAALFAKKGELITQLEVAQAQLEEVNKEIAKILNKQAKEQQK